MSEPVRITLEDDNGTAAPLFRQYPGQVSPQPAYLRILPKDNLAVFEYSGEVGNGTPEPVYHQRQIRIRVPSIVSREALDAFMADPNALALVQRVVDGHSVQWDGNNHVGKLTPDAEGALEDLESNLAQLDPTNVLSAAEYVRDGFTLAELARDGVDAIVANCSDFPEDCAVIGDIREAVIERAVELVEKYLRREHRPDPNVRAVIDLLVGVNADHERLRDDYDGAFAEAPSPEETFRG